MAAVAVVAAAQPDKIISEFNHLNKLLMENRSAQDKYCRCG